MNFWSLCFITNLPFSLTIRVEPQSDLHGPLEVSENEIPVLESCELSRNDPVQSLDLHIAECRIEIETLDENSLFYLIIELMDFWKNGLICISQNCFHSQ